MGHHSGDEFQVVHPLEFGKNKWDVAFYPVEDHSFRTVSAWTDECKRIFKLFENNLK